MRIKLKYPWFGPTEVFKRDSEGKFTYSGMLYPKDEAIDVPNDFKDILPKDAIIINEDDYVEDAVDVGETLKDYDTERVGQDVMQRRIDAARNAKQRNAALRRAERLDEKG